jgi:NADPH:quinone reductase-like Zn-dependent oxidoreductase
MKALVLRKEGLKIEEIPTPQPDINQVLVKINFAALNHRDQWIRVGQYAKIQLPAILGSDGCGEVIAVGSSENDFLLHKKVIINPNISWGDNTSFQDKNYQILGMPTQGTLAEYICVATDRIVLKPEYLTEQEAAALPLAGLTAYNALFNKGKATKGSNVLISGVGGGVAQFAFLFAMAVGCNVYVSSSKKDIISRCQTLGAKDGADYRDKESMKQMAADAGSFDIIIDSAGGDGMNDLLAYLKPCGRYVFYGATKGLPSALNLRMIFWNHLQILGTTMGSDEDFNTMVAFCNKYALHPIIDTVMDWRDVTTAFDRMASGSQFGKIVLAITP